MDGLHQNEPMVIPVKGIENEPMPLPVKGIDFAFSAEEGFLRDSFGLAADTFVKRLNGNTSNEMNEMPDEITSFLNAWVSGQPTKSIIPWDYEAYKISDMLCGTLALLYKGDNTKQTTAMHLTQKICTASVTWKFSSGSNIFGQLLATLTWIVGYYDSNAKTSELYFVKFLKETKNTHRYLIGKFFNTNPDFQHLESIIEYAHCWNELYENVSSPSSELVKDDLKKCKDEASAALHNFQEENNLGLDKTLWGAAIYLYRSLYPWTRLETAYCKGKGQDKDEDTIKKSSEDRLDVDFKLFFDKLKIDMAANDEGLRDQKRIIGFSIQTLQILNKNFKVAKNSNTPSAPPPDAEQRPHAGPVK